MVLKFLKFLQIPSRQQFGLVKLKTFLTTIRTAWIKNTAKLHLKIHFSCFAVDYD